jgi:hypothetical protein
LVVVVPDGGNGEDAGLGDPALELGLGELGGEVANNKDDLHAGDGEDVEPGARSMERT